MQVITSPAEMQQTALAWRRAGRRIGLVPTMGYLHEGHLSLVRLARQQTDVIVLSLFVNPTQFGPNEDLAQYPRDFERDRRLGEAEGVDVIFAPAADAMYPAGSTVYVAEQDLAQGLCGAFRPGHFRGVLTVVAKLFNLILPDVAVFGQKDAQQLRLIQQMAADLNFPLTIVAGPIIREPDGLALSSRNTYLTASQRRDALCLSNALKLARRLYRQGTRKAAVLEKAMRDMIQSLPSTRIDYIAIVDSRTLRPAPALETPVLIALAVWVGQTRLIDNLLLPDDRLSNLPE